MNHVTSNVDAARKFPVPEDLVGRWARNVKTRNFAYIVAASIGGVEYRMAGKEFPGAPESGPLNSLTLDRFAALYNLVPLKEPKL